MKKNILMTERRMEKPAKEKSESTLHIPLHGALFPPLHDPAVNAPSVRRGPRFEVRSLFE